MKNKIPISKGVSILLIGLCAMILTFIAISQSKAQGTIHTKDSIIYHERAYEVCIGTKGGHFVMLDDGSKMYVSSMERVRTASNVPIDNGDGSATYKNNKYAIH